MKLIILIAFAFALCAVPGVIAVGGCGGDFTPSCQDNETLLCSLNGNITGGTAPFRLNYTIVCNRGCINSDFEATSLCRAPVKPITSTYHLLFQIVAIILLVFSMVRKKEAKDDRVEYTYQHGIISLISGVLFFALALLTTEIIIVYINWMFAAVASIWTVYLYMMSLYPDDKAANKNPLRV